MIEGTLCSLSSLGLGNITSCGPVHDAYPFLVDILTVGHSLHRHISSCFFFVLDFPFGIENR